MYEQCRASFSEDLVFLRNFIKTATGIHRIRKRERESYQKRNESNDPSHSWAQLTNNLASANR